MLVVMRFNRVAEESSPFGRAHHRHKGCQQIAISDFTLRDRTKVHLLKLRIHPIDVSPIKHMQFAFVIAFLVGLNRFQMQGRPQLGSAHFSGPVQIVDGLLCAPGDGLRTRSELVYLLLAFVVGNRIHLPVQSPHLCPR